MTNPKSADKSKDLAHQGLTPRGAAERILELEEQIKATMLHDSILFLRDESKTFLADKYGVNNFGVCWYWQLNSLIYYAKRYLEAIELLGELTPASYLDADKITVFLEGHEQESK